VKLFRDAIVMAVIVASAVPIASQAPPASSAQPPAAAGAAPATAATAEPPANLTAAELQTVKIQWLTRENRILKAQQEMQQKIGLAEQEWQAFVQSLQRDGYELDLNTGVRTPAKKGGGTP